MKVISGGEENVLFSQVDDVDTKRPCSVRYFPMDIGRSSGSITEKIIYNNIQPVRLTDQSAFAVLNSTVATVDMRDNGNKLPLCNGHQPSQKCPA